MKAGVKWSPEITATVMHVPYSSVVKEFPEITRPSFNALDLSYYITRHRSIPGMLIHERCRRFVLNKLKNNEEIIELNVIFKHNLVVQE